MIEKPNNSFQEFHAQYSYHRLTNYLWVAAFVLFILSLMAVYFKISSSGDIVTLRYNIIIGVSEIGNKNELYKLPLTSLLIGLANFGLSKLNRTDQKIIALLAAIATVALNLLLLISILFLFRVN